MRDHRKILALMQVWRCYGSAPSVRERTAEQTAFDDGVMAAAEYVRRLMDYDETIALRIHDLLTTVTLPLPAPPGAGPVP
jgi:hypothetical protein